MIITPKPESTGEIDNHDCPLTINMSPEKEPFQMENPSNQHFSGEMLVFEGVYPNYIHTLPEPNIALAHGGNLKRKQIVFQFSFRCELVVLERVSQ